MRNHFLICLCTTGREAFPEELFSTPGQSQTADMVGMNAFPPLATANQSVPAAPSQKHTAAGLQSTAELPVSFWTRMASKQFICPIYSGSPELQEKVMV